jgi:two-component system, chemotaxis family, chemotaxis protein CheY
MGLIITGNGSRISFCSKMVMPIMTGYAVLKEIRQRFKDSHTAVIVQTSLNTKEDVMECAKLGIQGYIVKPPDLVTITEKILSCYAKLHPEKAKAAQARA